MDLIERTYLLRGPTLVVVLVGMILVSSVVGFLIGRELRASKANRTKSELDTIIATVLGLFGLLLGFTLSMALTRYDSRKVAVVEESNAIGTSFLRTRLLPAEHQAPTRALLREYIDADIEFYEVVDEPEKLSPVVARIEVLQLKLWDHAAAAAAADNHAITTVQFVQSLNQVIDSHATRVAKLRNSVPPVLLALLCAFALIGSGLTGYATGLNEHGDRIPVAIGALLTVSVLLVIVDIDRTRRGAISVGQQSMLDLRSFVEKQGP